MLLIQRLRASLRLLTGIGFLWTAAFSCQSPENGSQQLLGPLEGEVQAVLTDAPEFVSTTILLASSDIG